jgi:hypothetical protein
MKLFITFMCVCLLSCGFEEKYDATASPFDQNNPLYDSTKVAFEISASAGSGGVTLAWTPLTQVWGNLISGYSIYRDPPPLSEDATEEEEALARVSPYKQVGPDVTGYVDTDVKSGTTYTYYVTYFNSLDESERSNEVTVTP